MSTEHWVLGHRVLCEPSQVSWTGVLMHVAVETGSLDHAFDHGTACQGYLGKDPANNCQQSEGVRAAPGGKEGVEQQSPCAQAHTLRQD